LVIPPFHISPLLLKSTPVSSLASFYFIDLLTAEDILFRIAGSSQY